MLDDEIGKILHASEFFFFWSLLSCCYALFGVLRKFRFCFFKVYRLG